MLHVSEMSCWSSVFDKLVDCLAADRTTCTLTFVFADAFINSIADDNTNGNANGNTESAEPTATLSLASQSQSSDTVLIPTEPAAESSPQTASLAALLASPASTGPAPDELTLENSQCARRAAIIHRAFLQSHLLFLYDSPVQDPPAPHYSLSSPAVMNHPTPVAQHAAPHPAPKMSLVQADHLRQVK